ncbi:MAG: hypothetical protein K2L88_02055 [Clostridiales bacterium]|nr:hypothetical protein [Clostridiales bacterium]
MVSERQIEHDKMIDGLGINGVLDRYFGKADTFVLVSSFYRSHMPCASTLQNHAYVVREPYCRKYPKGRVKLQKLDADNALKEMEESEKKYLIKKYEKLSDEQKAELPPFETVFEEIKQECMEFNEKRKSGELEALGKEYGIDENKSLYILCWYEKGKVKYPIDNKFISCCYGWLGNIYANDDNDYEVLQTLMNNAIVRPLDYELRKPPFNELLPHLLSITPTFIAHCHGGLKKKFRFKFNEVTRAWLAEHYKFGPLTDHDFLAENDCCAYGLENLTFFDGDKVLFYQCSHERMQDDYLERFDD